MAQSTISIRMDEDLKKDFDYVCSKVGLNMSTAVTIFAKKMILAHGIPFDVTYDPFYEERNRQALRESRRQLESGKTVVKTLGELEEMADV